MTEQEKIGQRYLEAAFSKMHELYLEENPPIEGEVVYSPKYIKAINKLLGKKEKRYAKFFDSTYKRVAAFIVAAMLAIGSGIGVYAFRESIGEFITEIKDKFVEIFFDETSISQAPTEIKTVYTLGYVPEGYMFESSENKIIKATTVWSNGEDKIILWQQLLSNKENIDIETSDFEIIYVGNLEVICIEKYNYKYFYWSDNKYSFGLAINENISNDECVSIIESLKNN